MKISLLTPLRKKPKGNLKTRIANKLGIDLLNHPWTNTFQDYGCWNLRSVSCAIKDTCHYLHWCPETPLLSGFCLRLEGLKEQVSSGVSLLRGSQPLRVQLYKLVPAPRAVKLGQAGPAPQCLARWRQWVNFIYVTESVKENGPWMNGLQCLHLEIIKYKTLEVRQSRRSSPCPGVSTVGQVFILLGPWFSTFWPNRSGCEDSTTTWASQRLYAPTPFIVSDFLFNVANSLC